MPRDGCQDQLPQKKENDNDIKANFLGAVSAISETVCFEGLRKQRFCQIGLIALRMSRSDCIAYDGWKAEQGDGDIQAGIAEKECSNR